jgi:hypothetical protein
MLRPAEGGSTGRPGCSYTLLAKQGDSGPAVIGSGCRSGQVFQADDLWPSSTKIR